MCIRDRYWPAIELAVPLSCGNLPSGRGYALVRSADALGIGIGTLIGTAAATLGIMRTVYISEAVCMGAVLVLISLVPLQDGPPYRNLSSNSPAPGGQQPRPTPRLPWLLPLLPVLLISVVATGILALQQSALPLDLVRGGIVRPALSLSLIHI